MHLETANHHELTVHTRARTCAATKDALARAEQYNAPKPVAVRILPCRSAYQPQTSAFLYYEGDADMTEALRAFRAADHHAERARPPAAATAPRAPTAPTAPAPARPPISHYHPFPHSHRNSHHCRSHHSHHRHHHCSSAGAMSHAVSPIAPPKTTVPGPGTPPKQVCMQPDELGHPAVGVSRGHPASPLAAQKAAQPTKAVPSSARPAFLESWGVV